MHLSAASTLPNLQIRGLNAAFYFAANKGYLQNEAITAMNREGKVSKVHVMGDRPRDIYVYMYQSWMHISVDIPHNQMVLTRACR